MIDLNKNSMAGTLSALFLWPAAFISAPVACFAGSGPGPAASDALAWAGIVVLFLSVVGFFFIRGIITSIRNREKTNAESLAKRTRQLKQLNEHLVYSEEIERKTIASDLHDSIAQTLALGISHIKNLRESHEAVPPKNLEQIQTVLEQAVREVRSMIYKLSPPILDDFDIDIAIGFLVEETNAQKGTRFKYTNKLEDTVPLNHALKVTLYRAVSELLTNILKHAGTIEADIEIRTNGTMLFISVGDQGVGMDVQKAESMQGCGFGLYSLSERMENFGGSLEIDSGQGKGTHILLTAPVLTETDMHEKKDHHHRG